jgi:DNA mismatch repair protein MutL
VVSRRADLPTGPRLIPQIAVLPGDVADRIAAGEVVERPASVVKELVENALDAGATAVDVEVMEGGRALIRVSDDGHGMDRANATRAIERHATSKIRDAEDLVGVASFGFRGEALPAIGSVSQLTIDTATEDGAGITVEVSGGALRDVRPGARRRGTSVAVASLFFNTPARQKFLRGARSEWRAISDTLTILALVRRDVRFTVAHDGKEQMRLPVASSLRERVAALWSGGIAERLVAVDDVQGPIRTSGLVERPSDVGAGTRRLLVTVNGRAVRDNGIVRAAESAYRSTIQAGLRPSLLLEIELPGGEVDVNVHPAKAEVRFRDRWTVERAVERAVRRALGTEESSASMGYVRTFLPAEGTFGTPLGVEALRQVARPEEGTLFAGGAPMRESTERDAGTASGAVRDAGNPAAVQAEQEILVPALTQFHRTYITFERAESLVLIDQHSAHERVLYERFMGALERGDAPSQRLLFPLTLHLAPAEVEAFDEHRPLFARIGYEVEGFGGSSLLVHAVPNPHPRFDAERCLRDSLATLVGDREASAHARHERLAATVACKAAIKAGELLAPEEMRALYVALARTTLPAHDVHGRATILQLGWDELDRRFGRR